MTFVVGELSAPIVLDDSEFRRGLQRARADGDNFAGGITDSFRRIGPVIGASIAAGIGAALARATVEVNETLRLLERETGATGERLASHNEQFFRVLGAGADTAEDVARAIALVNARLEQEGVVLAETARSMLAVARITGEDVTRTAETATRVFGDWSVATEDQNRVLGRLVALAQSSGVELASLMETVVQYGTAFRTLGFSLEEAAALLARFEKEGVATETVLSGLKLFLGVAAKEGVNAAEAFRGLVSEIRELDRTAAIRRALPFFGQRATTDIVVAVQEGRDQLDGLLQQMRDGEVDVVSFADKTKTIGEGFREIGNAITTEVNPALTTMGNLTTNVLEAVAQSIRDIGLNLRILRVGIVQSLPQLPGLFGIPLFPGPGEQQTDRRPGSAPDRPRSPGVVAPPPPGTAEENRELEAILAALQRRYDQLTKTERVLLEARLRAAGATDEQVRKTLELLDATTRLESAEADRQRFQEARADREAFVLDIIRETATVEEERALTIGRLRAAQTVLGDDFADFELIIARVNARYDEFLQKNEQLSEVDRSIQDLGRSLQQVLAESIFNEFEDGLRGMLDGFRRVLAQMAAELASREILLAFFGSFAGAGGFWGRLATGALQGLGVEKSIALPQLALGLAPAGAAAVAGETKNYYIDARGAAPGMEERIVRAIELSERRAVAASVRAVADARARGGTFRQVFRG